MNLETELKKHADKKQAEILRRFFKTGKGEYGEGDIFLGIKVPVQRKIAKQFSDLSLKDIQILLNSKIHEKRLIALFILIDKYRKLKNSLSRIESKNESDSIRYKKAGEDEKRKIFDFYLANTKNINNWDLVDLSAPNIVGNFLLDKDRALLYQLAKSNSLWERRIAIISCFAFIRDNQVEDCLKISEILLKDKHDLIYKAVGWMLREVGKRDERILEDFLKKHYKEMPRTMLRYSIEKFEEGKRKGYLGGEI